jgi:type I restriction enzyme S subunit
MRKYDKYKPSGIEWVGDIPEHWEVEKLRYIGNFTASGIDKKINEDEASVKIINYTDIYGNATQLLSAERNYMEVTCSEEKRIEHQVRRGDLIFTPSSETIEDIGLSALVDEDLNNTAYSYHVLRFRFDKDVDHYFKKYLCNNHFVLNQFSANAKGTTRQILNRENFNSALVILPPELEQTTIANFLDEKTAQVDKLIANKQNIIELLKEERKAIINQAITHGINPNVKLKPSGIEWLGNIPEQWELRRMRFLVDYVKGFAFKSDFFVPDGIPIVKASDIKNFTIRKGKDFLDPSGVNQFEKVKLKTNDIIISTVGSTPDVINSAVGQIAIVPSEFSGSYLNQNTVKFFSKVETKLDNYFLFCVLISNPYRKYLDLHAHGTANQASLNIEDMLNFIVTFPNIIEQKAIAEYIETETKRIDNTITQIEKEIQLLQEYRTALISEVVTGKIKVI